MYNDKIEILLDSIHPIEKTISIAIIHNIVNEEGKRISEVSRHRMAFVPGEFNGVMEFLDRQAPGVDKSEILAVLSALWTQEVIDYYTSTRPEEL